MLKTLFTVSASLLAVLPGRLAARPASAPRPYGSLPNAAQMLYYRQAVGALICYGPNTYWGPDGIEWGNHAKYTPDSMFLPKTLDTDQWVTVCRDAGIRRLIFVAKHHDGFRLWKTDGFSVAQMRPERNPNGIDLLEEVSRSCTKFGMDMGLYLSPWDVYEDKGRAMQGKGSGTYGQETHRFPNDPYNLLYRKHLREILCDPQRRYGRNGTFVEFWQDGAKNDAKPQTYDFGGWNRIAKSASGKDPDGRPDPARLTANFEGGNELEIAWVGNEQGRHSPNCPSRIRLPRPDGAWAVHCASPTGNRWVVWEGDFPLRPGWYFHTSQNGRVKTAADLFGRYMSTVGNGGVMLIGLAPDRTGKLHDEDVKQLRGFGRLLREIFGTDASGEAVTDANNLLHRNGCRPKVTSDVPLRAGSPAYAPDRLTDAGDGAYDTYWAGDDSVRRGTVTVEFGGTLLFDLVRLSEYIPLGQRIDCFSVEVRTDRGWQPFAKGTYIGYKRLLQGPVTRADALRITVSSPYAVPILNDLGIYRLPAELRRGPSGLPRGLKTMDITLDCGIGSGETYYTRDIERRRNMLGGSVLGLHGAGSYKEFSFTGSKFWLRAMMETNRRWASDALLSIDGGTPVRVNLSRPLPAAPHHPYIPGNRSQTVYVSPDLKHGDHAVRIIPAAPSWAVYLDALIYCDARGGLFEFADEGPVSVREGETLRVSVRRLGDASRAASVTVMPYPGTAVHGEDFEQTGQILNFAPGEKEKTAEIRTLTNTKREKDQYFLLRLEPASDAVPESFGMELRADITEQGETPPAHAPMR